MCIQPCVLANLIMRKDRIIGGSYKANFVILRLSEVSFELCVQFDSRTENASRVKDGTSGQLTSDT